MNPFTFIQATDEVAAIRAVADDEEAKFLGGGTNLIDLMRQHIEHPKTVVDITHLALYGIEELPDGSLLVGALVKNTQLAGNPLIRSRYPILSQAILNGASQQLRNMATTGGNIMQRTRCYYFYDLSSHCNKREPGSGCDAIGGLNRIHAILGTSDYCIATHPSDMCVALTALGATILIKGKNGRREIAFNDFHRLPGDTPEVETNLQPGELITGVKIPSLDFAKHSAYRKVRDRASYAFALVSVAGALQIENKIIKNARIALGGVAHKPWRAFEAEQILIGSPATAATFERAAEAELKNAKGFEFNSFKIELAKKTIIGILNDLSKSSN